MSERGKVPAKVSWVRSNGFLLALIGAVIAAFVFPVVLYDTGTDILLSALVLTSLLGALVTWWFRIETKGVNLEEIGR